MRTFVRTRFLAIYLAVVVIQGIHVVEHVIQLLQVYAFGVPDDQALGLLGYVFAFQGTEEWLHLVFNVTYLLALYLILFQVRHLVPRTVPYWAYFAFAAGGTGLETWHVIEHAVIITNVIRNNGCPCPGIGDRALGITDTVLHFFYNALAYAATLAPFWFVAQARPRFRSAAPAMG
jgi:hypothetical protein